MGYITIVRHGQSESNLAGIVESRNEGKLTQTGTETARVLGQFLKDENFTRIYCSDLFRCKQTLNEITSQLEAKMPTVDFREDLRERDFGDKEHLPTSVIWDEIMKLNIPLQKAHTRDIVNGESYETARDRGRKFLDEIFSHIDADDEDSENILVVSHGVFILCLLDNILLNPEQYDVQGLTEECLERLVRNTSRTRFSVSRKADDVGGKRAIKFTHYFDLQHLEVVSSKI